MKDERKPRRGTFTLVELIIGLLLLAGVVTWGVRATLKARHEGRVRQIIDAMNHDDEETVFKLARAHPELFDAKDKDGETPLHFAVGRNAKDVAALLIAKGSDVNAKSNEGLTPLHIAVRSNARDVVPLLLAKGADMNAKDKEGDTPLHIATLNHNDHIADLLRAHGAKE